MSDSSPPHGLQPTRLLHPWEFPGKSTGVGWPLPSPGRKARSLQREEIGRKCQTLFISLLSGRRRQTTSHMFGFPGGSAGKESPCNAGDPSSIPGLGRSPGEGKVYPLQYSGLENSMDCIVHKVVRVGHDWVTLNVNAKCKS